MAQLTQRGLVYSVGQTEYRQYKDKTFVSRCLVIEQPRFDNYTGEKMASNYIKLEAAREDICASLDRFPVGSKVEVEFMVRGSKYTKKDGSGEDVFTHLELRSIELAGSGAAVQPATAASPIPRASAPVQAPIQAPPVAGDYDLELGF